MTRVTDFAQAREQCREVVACLDLPGPYDQERLSAVLGRLIGGTVRDGCGPAAGTVHGGVARLHRFGPDRL